MKKAFLFCFVLIFSFCCIGVSYGSSIFFDVSTYLFRLGRVSDSIILEGNYYPDYKYERLYFDFYLNEKLVKSIYYSFTNYELKYNKTLEMDLKELNLSPGEYTIKYYFKYYNSSNGTWIAPDPEGYSMYWTLFDDNQEFLGFVEMNDKLYYFKPGDINYSGWINEDGIIYFIYILNEVATGQTRADNLDCVFDNDGHLLDFTPLKSWNKEGKSFCETYGHARAEKDICPICGVFLGHTLESHERKEATCTETGTEAYWECSSCKKLFSDADGKNEINNIPVIQAKGHSLISHDRIEATGKTSGIEAYWECSECKKLFSDEKAKYEITKPIQIPILTPQDLIQAFVTRCYKLILGRDPDTGGLQGWSASLSNKTASAAQIIDGFVKSDEFTNRKLSDSAKVDILYKTMLNREADAGGKAGWVDALSKGYTLQNIIDGFCGSAEFTAMCKDYGIEPGSIGASIPTDTSTPRGKIEAFVKRCYQLILNRQADEGGLKGWSDALEGKTAAAAQIIDGFVRSPEYINRNLTSDQSVTILYKTMLDRDPDEGGKAGWVDALSKGYTLQHIINGFCGSAEFTKICSDYGIEAGSVAVPVQSAAALEAAAQLEAKKLPDERIGNAVSADDAGITVVNGYEPAEVEAFVKHAYRAALGREADEAGLAGWTEQIVSGAVAPKAFLRSLLFSDEQIARKLNNEQFIEMLYRLYLNRGTDDAAAERIAQLAAGGLDEVIKGFEGSAEFRLVLNGFGL